MRDPERAWRAGILGVPLGTSGYTRLARFGAQGDQASEGGQCGGDFRGQMS